MTTNGLVAKPPAAGAAALLEVYRTAHTIKTVDEALRQLVNEGKFLGFFYSPRGQEVLAAAVGACIRPDDYLVTTYRGLHDQIAKGVSLPELIAELYGKRTGTCKGKGGPMHVSDPGVGLMVTTGIVGGGIPIGVGLALAAKLRGTDQVCVVSFGDGATNIGAFHEAVNLAAVWTLPVVFVCQNNEYAEYTPRHDTQLAEVVDHAAAYGIPGVAVDGNDAAAMLLAVADAVARACAGHGPTLLDCKTFRFMGHFYGEPQAYMDKDELARRMADDPVDRLRAEVLAAGAVDEASLAVIEAEVGQMVNAAVDFVQTSPDPRPEELLDDIYAVPA